VTRSKKNILMSQRKCVLDLLLEVGMLGYKSIDSLMDVNTKLLPDQGSFLRMLGGTGDWRKTELPEGDQIGHHIHSQCGVSHFLSALRTTHLEAVTRILMYLKKASWRTFLFRSWIHSNS